MKPKNQSMRSPIGYTSFHHPQMKGVKLRETKSRLFGGSNSLSVPHGSVHSNPIGYEREKHLHQMQMKKRSRSGKQPLGKTSVGRGPGFQTLGPR